MLTKEVQGDEIKMSLLTIHSQDHLMTVITFKDMAAEMIDLYKKMDSKA